MFLVILSFVFGLMSNVKSEEPTSCSQFYYVDKLLDKMIRMEIKGESLDKDISKTNEEVVSALEALRQEREKFKADIADLRKQVEEDLKKEVEDRLKNLDDVINQQEDVIRELKTPNILFKARSPRDLKPQQGDTIVFQENMMNHGEGYNNITGIFTAPVSGAYLFIIHLCLLNQRNMYYGLMYNNEVQTSGHFYDNNAYTCNTADGMLSLKQGDRVWIKNLYGSSSSDVFFEYSSSTYNYWSTFSGVLIHK